MSRGVVVGTLSSYTMDALIGYRGLLRKLKDAPETVCCLRSFLLPSQKPGRIFPDISTESFKACQDLQTHGTNTPRRSETNGIAEREVFDEKEGTVTAMVQRVLPDLCWNCAMEGYCYFRNVHDKTADGKRAYEKM